MDSNTFPRILKELLGKKNFALKKELEGQPLVAPPWSHCLSYEYELRREAHKRCREQSMGFNAAWWSACSDTEHRMLHWLQLVSLANSAPASPATVYHKSCTERSRCTTPRKRCGPESEQQEMGNTWKARKQEIAAHWAAAARSPQFFVVNSRTKGKPEEQGQGEGAEASRPGRRPPAGKVWTLNHLLAGGDEVASMLFRNEGNGVCYRFQEGTCQLDPCTRSHVCIGCGGPRGYNQCQCLQSRLAALP